MKRRSLSRDREQWKNVSRKHIFQLFVICNLNSRDIKFFLAIIFLISCTAFRFSPRREKISLFSTFSTPSETRLFFPPSVDLSFEPGRVPPLNSPLQCHFAPLPGENSSYIQTYRNKLASRLSFEGEAKWSKNVFRARKRRNIRFFQCSAMIGDTIWSGKRDVYDWSFEISRFAIEEN